MILVETDRIILSCDTTGFTMAVSYENCSAFTNTSASTTAMWAATTSETTSATDELLVVYYDWEIDENTGAEREGIITYAYTDDDGNQYSIDIPIKQGTGISYSGPIWKDVYYTASTSPFEYSIRYNGVDVYYGKAYAKPSESGVRVKVNTICSNYIRMRLDDMRQYEDDVVGNEAFGAFDLCDSDGVALMRYKFLMDWSGEWSGQSPYVMTDLINGHIDPRMKMLFTVYCDNVTELDWEIDDNEGEIDWRERPVTFHILTGGTLTITETNDPASSGSGHHRKWYYKNGVYSDYLYSDVSIDVVAGDVVELYGLSWEYRWPTVYMEVEGSYPANIITIGGTCSFNVSGNLMSLTYGSEFQDKTEWPVLQPNTQSVIYGYESMCSLFRGSNVVSASDLILPITDLTKYNVLSPYASMFNNCTKLKYAPQLPATTLSQACYAYMFDGCTELISAPDLPAQIPTSNSYYMMFNMCSSLNYVKCLRTNFSYNSTENWLNGVSSTGTFVKASSASWNRNTGSYTRGVPVNWTIINDE